MAAISASLIPCKLYVGESTSELVASGIGGTTHPFSFACSSSPGRQLTCKTKLCGSHSHSLQRPCPNSRLRVQSGVASLKQVNNKEELKWRKTGGFGGSRQVVSCSIGGGNLLSRVGLKGMQRPSLMTRQRQVQANLMAGAEGAADDRIEQQVDSESQIGPGRFKLKFQDDEAQTSFRDIFLKLTPARVLKLSLIALSLWGAGHAFVALMDLTLLNPALWVYGTWALILYPWPGAVGLGMWSVLIALKAAQHKAEVWEQCVMLAGALVWLVLVPLAKFQGFVDGWPLGLLGLYYFFFSSEGLVRWRNYAGNMALKENTTTWDSRTHPAAKFAFLAATAACHVAAAKEAFQMERHMPKSNYVALAVLLLALHVRYDASFFLAKYFYRWRSPQKVVTFGPYHFVRHPMFLSNLLLFAGYGLALRSYWSMGTLVVIAFIYYHYRANLEEEELLERFKDEYEEYRGRVTKKFFPFIY
eukprot:jgi/Mesen1/3656/ME000200S02728